MCVVFFTRLSYFHFFFFHFPVLIPLPLLTIQHAYFLITTKNDKTPNTPTPGNTYCPKVQSLIPSPIFPFDSCIQQLTSRLAHPNFVFWEDILSTCKDAVHIRHNSTVLPFLNGPDLQPYVFFFHWTARLLAKRICLVYTTWDRCMPWLSEFLLTMRWRCFGILRPPPKAKRLLTSVLESCTFSVKVSRII